MYCSLRVCLSSKAQETVCDPGCTRTCEPIVDFWYVSKINLESNCAERENSQGHQWYLQAGEAGAEDQRFLEDFGNVVRWNGPFGVRLAFYRTHVGVLYSGTSDSTCLQEDCLWIADPKAIHHILQKSGYFYAKPSNNREQVALLADRDGIASAEGELPIMIRPFWTLALLTIPKVTHTGVTDG